MLMESLLSVSFDSIASRDLAKTRKGLRQVEGLLAQICLSPASSGGQTPANKRRSSTLSAINHTEPIRAHDSASSPLGSLTNDLAFLEFFRLQESFEWNVAIRLIECLERLLGLRSTDQTNQLIISTLDLIHGMLLLHPRSRALFSRETHMTLLLDLLDPENPPSILSSAITTLLSTLLDSVRNTRLFEAMDGIPTLVSLFHSDKLEQGVRIRLMEVFSYYIMPEMGTFAPLNTAISTADAAMANADSSMISSLDKNGGVTSNRRHQRTNSSVKSHRSNPSTGGEVAIKSPEEKQAILERHLQHANHSQESQPTVAGEALRDTGHHESLPLHAVLLA